MTYKKIALSMLVGITSLMGTVRAAKQPLIFVPAEQPGENERGRNAMQNNNQGPHQHNGASVIIVNNPQAAAQQPNPASNHQPAKKCELNNAWNYVASSFPVKIVKGSVKTGAGLAACYGTYLAAKPAVASYKAASNFSQDKNLDLITRDYALFGARTQYLGYGAVSLTALGLGAYLCKSGLIDIRSGVKTAYSYIAPVVTTVCSAGKAVGRGALAAWKNPYGKYLISAGTGAALGYLAYKNQEFLMESCNNAKDFTVAKCNGVYERMFSSENNSHEVTTVLELPATNGI